MLARPLLLLQKSTLKIRLETMLPYSTKNYNNPMSINRPEHVDAFLSAGEGKLERRVGSFLILLQIQLFKYIWN